MCSQYVNDADAHPAGRVIDCDSVSVWAVPYPSNHASLVPPCAGSAVVAAEITPDVWVHGVVPLSKPPLAITWSPHTEACASAEVRAMPNRLTASASAAG